MYDFELVGTLNCREHNKHAIGFYKDIFSVAGEISFICRVDSWNYRFNLDPIHYEQDRFYIYQEIYRGFIELYKKGVCSDINHRKFIKDFFLDLIFKITGLSPIERLNERLQYIIGIFNNEIDHIYRNSVNRPIPIPDVSFYDYNIAPRLYRETPAFAYANQWFQAETERAFRINSDKDAESVALDLIKKNFENFNKDFQYEIKSKIANIFYFFHPLTNIDTIDVGLNDRITNRLGHLCLLIKNKNFRPNKYDRLLQRMLLAKYDEKKLWKESYFHGSKEPLLENNFVVNYYKLES